MKSDVRTDSATFRSALGAFATGITVVTTIGSDGRDIGLTVNSFNSVSLDPPMVLWSLSKASSSLDSFQASGSFAVHVLSSQQESLSRRFARRGVDRFRGLDVERGERGVPLLGGCAARFQCRTAFEYEGGDHVIFVGEVVAFDHSERPPLVFHGGSYAVAVKRPLKDVLPAVEPTSNFSQDFLGYLLGVAHYRVSSQVRDQLDRRGLSDEEYLLLGMAAAGGERTLAEVDEAIRFTGRRATLAVQQALAQRGLIQDLGDDRLPIHLTEPGRALLIEMAAVAKAAEADAEEGLDYGERQLLKQLLRRVIRGTDPIERSPVGGEQPAS